MATISNQNTIIIVIVIKIFSGLELHGAGPCPCAPWVALREMGSVELARRGSAFLFFGFSPAFLRTSLSALVARVRFQVTQFCFCQ
jgi:hypothetical protein